MDYRRLWCRTPAKWFGGDFSVKCFGFWLKSQSYRPKVGVTDQKSELQPGLEAQQRYFSYRAILAAIVSQNFFVLVFMGYHTIIARYVAKWGIAQMCLCKIKYQGGVSHHFGGMLTSLKRVSRDMGYRSDSIAVSRDMGPLSSRGDIQNPNRIARKGTRMGFRCFYRRPPLKPSWIYDPGATRGPLKPRKNSK